MRTLGFAILDLFHRRTHIGASSIVGRVYFRTQTQGGTGAVKGGKATADNDDFLVLVNGNGQALNFFTQEGDSVDHAISIVARYIQFIAGPTTDGEIDSIKTLSEKIINGEVLPKFDVRLKVYTEVPDVLNFTIHHVLLQTVLRNTVAQHTTWLRLHIKDLAVMAFERKIVGTGEAAWASAHNRNLLTGRRVLHKGYGCIEQTGLGGMTMHATDSNFFLDQCAAARFLAGSRTGKPQDIGERQHFHDQTCSLFH